MGFSKDKLSWLAAIIIIIVFIVFSFLPPQDAGQFKAIFFDVGQGDSAMILTPDNKKILIDGGPDNTVIYKLSKYLPWWQRDLDLVVLSHPHADHLIGLIEVLKRYNVKEVWLTGAIAQAPGLEEFNDLIKEKNIPVKIVQNAVGLEIEPEVFLQIFYPLKNLAGQNFEDPNKASLVLKVSYKTIDLLFPGDLEKDEQAEILNEDLESEILKVPHQGSANALNKDFLEKVSPEIAVIPVGKNTFGHPSPRVLKALERASIKTYTTQNNGDVEIISDGLELEVKVQR